MKSIVGYTGFVGSNISLQTNFDALYNSQNIFEAYGTNPDLLIYSGVKSEKFLANNEPEIDYKHIENAIHNIKNINPKSIVLISTVDIYKVPNNVNEDSVIDTDNLQPYGLNRYKLESWVENNCKKHLIVRLPGLFGKNLKKNFIYDMMNIIPHMLSEKKFIELNQKNKLISKYYFKQENNFYVCKDLLNFEKLELHECFSSIGFSALNFTDSRGIFQFYNLDYLWNHIKIALDNNLSKINLVTEPIIISELYKYIKGSTFSNEILNNPPIYNVKTKYDKLFGRNDNYIFDKSSILNMIKKFFLNQPA